MADKTLIDTDLVRRAVELLERSEIELRDRGMDPDLPGEITAVVKKLERLERQCKPPRTHPAGTTLQGGA